MLSYRHSFHAGNAADVLKHTVLVFCLKYLTQKEKALLCVDTHAGAGAYRFGENKTDEWQKGIGKLWNCPDLPKPAADYLDLVQKEKGMYPGSPLIMASLLRGQDRLVCFELHPADYAELKTVMETYGKSGTQKIPKTEVRRDNGPESLKSLLPPPSGRGLILIDPPWEEKDEYREIPLQTAAGIERFPRGVWIIWYPLLDKPRVTLPGGISIGEALFRLFPGSRCRIELHYAAAQSRQDSPRGMYGCGLVIFNPPWTLRRALEELLPFLANVLGSDAGGEKWSVEWVG